MGPEPSDTCQGEPPVRLGLPHKGVDRTPVGEQRLTDEGLHLLRLEHVLAQGQQRTGYSDPRGYGGPQMQIRTPVLDEHGAQVGQPSRLAGDLRRCGRQGHIP